MTAALLLFLTQVFLTPSADSVAIARDQSVNILQGDGMVVRVPLEPSAASRLPAAPETPGGWSILVATGGGLSQETTELTMTSTGTISCQDRPCRTSVDRSELSALSILIAQPWSDLHAAFGSVCSDCSRTTLLVMRRDEAGAPRVRELSWDVTTQSRVPPDALRLFSSITTLTRPADAR